jgi:hypothetical protein
VPIPRSNARYWHLSVWLDPALKGDVEALARREGLTVSGLVKHLLARALAQQRADPLPPPARADRSEGGP